MNLIQKIDIICDKLIIIVDSIKLIKQNTSNNAEQLQSILAVALHYCHVLITIKDISMKDGLSEYKKEIKEQIGIIEKFIDLTEDLI